MPVFTAMQDLSDPKWLAQTAKELRKEVEAMEARAKNLLTGEIADRPVPESGLGDILCACSHICGQCCFCCPC